MFSIEGSQRRQQNRTAYFIVRGPYCCNGPGPDHGPGSVHRLGKAATHARELSRDDSNGLHGYGGLESTQE